jgi:Alpha-galactosidase, CBM13 domain
VLIIRGTDGKAARYEAASSANELEGGAQAGSCSACTGGKSVALGGEKRITFKIAPVKRAAYVRIAYVNPHKNPVMTELSASGQTPVNVLFPPTGNALGAIVVEVEPAQPLGVNSLTFATLCGSGPELDSISILP